MILDPYLYLLGYISAIGGVLIAGIIVLIFVAFKG